MSYEVTATRRRPQDFDSLVGQEFVAATLKNSIETKKIAHAYLFSGPRGCGKTSTSRILAKALNCQKGPTATPCGVCDNCKEITAGSSVDVIEIDGASNTGVNDVRQIKEEILFQPSKSKYKIYIIDEVHMLSTPAFNALLKTIEEPPPYVIFIFATTELQKVPATIKSRCQQFNFRLVPIEKVKEQLALAAQEIGIQADDEALYWIARESTGSMRDSYTLFDQVAAFSDKHITYDKIKDKLGLVGVDRLNELFGLCVKQDSTSALLKLDEYLQNGVSIEQLISNCTDYLRSLLLIKNGIKKEALLGQSCERYSQEVLNAWNNIQLERAISLFFDLYRNIRYSLSPRYEMELTISRLCWLKDYVSPTEVKKAIDAVKPMISGMAFPKKIQVNENGEPFNGEANANTSGGFGANNVNNYTSENNTANDDNFAKVAHNAENSQSAPNSNATATATAEAPRPAPKSFPGMPVFSALSQTPGKDSSGPFLNGGATPPEQSKVPVFDRKLSDMNLDSDDVFIPEDDYNPDQDSGAPDTDDFSSYGSYSDFSDTEASDVPDDSEENSDKEQNQYSAEIHIPSANTPLNIEDINSVKEALISDFSLNETLLASALMQCSDWVVNNQTVSCKAKRKFEVDQLNLASAKISGYLSKVFGKQMFFKAELKIEQAHAIVRQIPENVQFISDTFRGKVL